MYKLLDQKAITKIQAIIIAVVIIIAAICGGLAYYFMTLPPAKGEIVIGGSLPLTGIYSDTGKWIEKGYRYWADEINAKGGLLGKPVRLIIYDDESDVSKATSYLEKAITVDKVDLLLGGYPGTACVAQMAVAEKYHMVYVSMGGHMASFSQGYKYSFGAPPLMGEWWATGFVQFLGSLPSGVRPKSAAIITMDNVIGRACRTSMEPLKDLGISIVLDERYALPVTYETIVSLISRAKAANAELFFANGFFDDGVMTIRACMELGYEPKAIFQSVGCIIPEWVTQLGKYGNYVFSGTPLHWKLPYVKDERPDLIEYCQKTYGGPPPQYFLFGYCWMQVLQKAVEGVGRIDQDAIKDWLRTHTVHCLAGDLTFDEKGLPQPYSYCTQIINGTVELIWPLNVRTAEPIYPRPNWSNY
jgi:branched-chain amino acid transport system substrate-binding protein